MKYSILRLIFVILICFRTGTGQSVLNNQLIYISTDDTLSRAQWSVYAEYCDSGEQIIDLNPDDALAPASSLKIVATGLALDKLGPEYRFVTRLYYDGNINRKGTLDGNLYLAGGGDPTLGSVQLEGATPLDSLLDIWTTAVSAAGIKRINGTVIADVSLFEEQAVPDYWPWTDIGNYYGAGTSALCIHDNLYFLTFKPGLNVGDPAKVIKVEPQIPGLQFINNMKTGSIGSGDNGYIFCGPKQYTAVLRGTVPAGVDEFTIKGSIPDPALFAAQALSGELRRNGIKIITDPVVDYDSQKYDSSHLISKIASPPLSEIVTFTNRKSVNLNTEQLLLAVARQETGTGSREAGLELVETILDSLGIETLGWQLFDASGLSRTNRVSARQLSTWLTAMSKTQSFGPYYESFSVAGDPEGIGYVKSFGKGTALAYNGRIKTGMISGVRSHSGYLHTQSGRLVSFALICNNYPVSTRTINRIHETILVELARIK